MRRKLLGMGGVFSRPRKPLNHLEIAVRWCSDLIDDEYRERVMATFLFRHPRRDRKSESRKSLAVALFLAVLVGVYLAAVTVAPLLAMSGQTSAGTGPKAVWGFVYDGTGEGIDDVLVTVTVEDPLGAVRATEPYTTFVSGFYTVSFDNTQWFVGDTIVVSAELDGETATNSTVIEGEGEERIDLHFMPEIPEIDPGMTAAATVSLLVMVMLAVRRRHGRDA